MVKGKKDQRSGAKLMKAFSIFVTLIFISSIFVVFTQRTQPQTQKFYLKIQIKDYTNPTQGYVQFEDGENLTVILGRYGIVMNDTCIRTDYLYCNDNNYKWIVTVNGEVYPYFMNYTPKDGDQIIFKYSKI